MENGCKSLLACIIAHVYTEKSRKENVRYFQAVMIYMCNYVNEFLSTCIVDNQYMYVCNNCENANEKDKNKKLVMFIFSYALFSEFLLFVLFFHLGLFYWSGSQSFMSEQLAFLFTTPLNFQKRKVNIYDFFATFCFIVVFVSLHQHQLHWRQFTFLKGDQSCYFHLY